MNVTRQRLIETTNPTMKLARTREELEDIRPGERVRLEYIDNDSRWHFYEGIFVMSEIDKLNLWSSSKVTIFTFIKEERFDSKKSILKNRFYHANGPICRERCSCAFDSSCEEYNNYRKFLEFYGVSQ
ncbi:hypothetical protein HYW74_00445 [Candidatus Pacearchaeota archaeon]|nr:hypothetical protein [Candidatus Pacearchaeota archaeon]